MRVIELRNMQDKLRHPVFMMLKLWNPKNVSKYMEGEGLHNVLVDGVLYCRAKLLGVTVVKLKDIDDSIAHNTMGMSKNKLVPALRRIQKNEVEWKGDDTQYLLMIFMKQWESL